MDPTLSTTSAGLGATDEEISATVASICDQYSIKDHPVFVREMGGVRGGLGNAIPVPIPLRRIYVVRFHRCIRQADALALRGLFAHELMHIVQYSRAKSSDLWRFITRYSTFSATASRKKPIAFNWVRAFEHLTDLMAVKYGEGASIAGWKRFKAEATVSGLIDDSWNHLYLEHTDIASLADDAAALNLRIQQCVTTLNAVDALHPFARRT